jgi:hypothetical protein
MMPTPASEKAQEKQATKSLHELAGSWLKNAKKLNG